nr:hypothetical protein [Tanacetum cinerariifolium]
MRCHDTLETPELTNDEIKNSKAYKEYYAIATGEADPKPKANVRRARSSSDTPITPPNAAASLRLTAFAKGKQTAKASKAKSADEGTGSIPGVPDVSTDSWKSTDDEGNEEDEGDDGEEGKGDDNDEDDDGDDDDDDDHEEEKNDDKDNAEESRDADEEGGGDEQEYDEEDDDEETRDEESFDPIPQKPKSSKDKGTGAEDIGLNVEREEGLNEEEEEDELYRDQESLLVSSQFVTSMLNPTLDVGMESIFETTSRVDVQTPTSVAPLPITTPIMTSSTIATSTTTSQAQILPTATNQFAGAVSAIPSIVQHYMDQRMNEAVKVAVQIQSDRLRNEAQRENDEFRRTVDENIKKIIKEQVKEQVKMELKKIFIEKIEGNKSIQRLDEQRNLYKALVDAYESDKIILIILDTYGKTVTLKRRRDDDEDKDEEPSAGPDRGSKRRREGKEPESASTPSETATRSAGRSTTGSRSRQASTSESALAEEPIKELVKQADTRSSFNELMDTPLDFSNFLMNRVRVDTLTPELLTGPTYELMKGSCKSLIELEYHLEEVYKATTDQLDWVNPEGQQYPNNLLQPLPLIPDNRGRRVIPFAHFINNDLEYLRGGTSSRKYTTSITKTKAADYWHIKWIEDLVPRTMWINEPIGYDKHTLWGVSHWGRKRQQFYGFAINRESACNVYSKRRIITKRLNLTNLETYRSDLKRKEAYTAYSNPRGFVYHNKDKKNMLMRIDELHKFSNGMLIDLRTAFDDCLKGIRMRYLPQTIWRKSDKDRAAAVIQAIDKRLKTRRIMSSLERFVGGRLYEGDFRATKDHMIYRMLLLSFKRVVSGESGRRVEEVGLQGYGGKMYMVNSSLNVGGTGVEVWRLCKISPPEKFLRTVRFGNNDFAVIAGYGDVVIGSMTIKKVYYVEGLGHNLFSVGQFCDNGLEVAFRKSTCFVRNKDGVDLLTDDRSSNLYTIALNELKAKGDIGVFFGYSKESAAFRIHNKQTRKIHESVNVNFDEISEMASKQFSLEPNLSKLNKSEISLNPSVSKVSKASKKDLEDLFQDFYDEYFDSSKIMKSSTTNVETSNAEIPSHGEEVFHEIPINMVPNRYEASTSHNMFNERLKDAYFDASTSFHDPFNVHTYYQPYPHEKKWTKDHPLHKIIGDLTLSVRTRGQLVNSCLFSCLLSFFEPANVVEALRDADWVSAMQEELDQFSRLKVWRLVPRPEGKSIIKTKWIFKNKKDESSLVIRNKAMLVAVGYSQQEGIDYDETFAPIMKSSTTNVETSIYKEVFHEVSESFQGESSSSSL